MDILYSDSDILMIIKNLILPIYVGNSKIFIKENKAAGYNSIRVSCEKSAYRINATADMLLATVKTTSQVKYVGLLNIYRKDLQAAKIPFTEIKSSNYLRLPLYVFSPLSGYEESIKKIINKIFINLFCFESFGCCGKYVECSDAKHCIHDDKAFSTACMYRKNLESGRIFYGKNKNI